MVRCPHCSRPDMSLSRKAALGPGRIVFCQACGKAVVSHWTGLFAAAPAFLGGYVLMKDESLLLGLAAVVGGILVMAALQTFLVPLARAER